MGSTLPSITSFLSIAADVLAWIDRSDTPTPRDMLTLHWLLGRLQVAVLELPTVTSEEQSTAVVQNSKSRGSRFAALTERLERIGLTSYRKVLFPLDDKGELSEGSLADDLADIYSDVESGLAYAREGKYLEAIWEWRFLYFSHWGYHLAGAQACLRQYLDQNAASWFEPPKY
jgi:hypothetical protein